MNSITTANSQLHAISFTFYRVTMSYGELNKHVAELCIKVTTILQTSPTNSSLSHQQFEQVAATYLSPHLPTQSCLHPSRQHDRHLCFSPFPARCTTRRVPQLASELLVVGITWWYTYESYRIRKGTKLGNTISSLLFYNGEWTHGPPYII